MVSGIGDVADQELTLEMSLRSNCYLVSARRQCKRRTCVTSTCRRASCGLQIGGRGGFSAIGVNSRGMVAVSSLPRRGGLTWIRSAELTWPQRHPTSATNPSIACNWSGSSRAADFAKCGIASGEQETLSEGWEMLRFAITERHAMPRHNRGGFTAMRAGLTALSRIPMNTSSCWPGISFTCI